MKKILIVLLIILLLIIIYKAAGSKSLNLLKKNMEEETKDSSKITVDNIPGETIDPSYDIGPGMPEVSLKSEEIGEMKIITPHSQTEEKVTETFNNGENNFIPTPTIPLGTRGGTDPWRYSGEWRDRNVTTYGNTSHKDAPFLEIKENDMASFGYQGYNSAGIKSSPIPYIQPQVRYAENLGYSNCYPTPAAEDNEGDVYAERQGDESLAHIGLQRGQRDKKAQDGWASKNSNYFKKFYSNELEEYEAKPWWGNNEY